MRFFVCVESIMKTKLFTFICYGAVQFIQGFVSKFKMKKILS